MYLGSSWEYFIFDCSSSNILCRNEQLWLSDDDSSLSLSQSLWLAFADAIFGFPAHRHVSAANTHFGAEPPRPRAAPRLTIQARRTRGWARGRGGRHRPARKRKKEKVQHYSCYHTWFRVKDDRGQKERRKERFEGRMESEACYDEKRKKEEQHEVRVLLFSTTSRKKLLDHHMFIHCYCI